MKTKDAKVGQVVLFSTLHPTSSRSFERMDCFLGRIVETHVTGTYRVTEGGWGGSYAWRDADNLLRIEVLGYQGEGRGIDCGKVLVVRPAMVDDPIKNSGGPDVWRDHWAAHNEQRDARIAAALQQDQTDAARDARIEAVTGGMSLAEGRMVEIPSDVLDTLLALAELASLGAKVEA